MTKEMVIRQYDFNLLYAKKLVEDLDPNQMTTSPSPGFENHPAFTLGHLVTGSAETVKDLGGAYSIPDNWNMLFLRTGPGDPKLPETDPDLYPSKNELIGELENQHSLVKKYFLEASDTLLSENTKWRFSSYMPTLYDIVCFMCINHEAMHLGQLSAWRRAMKLPSALKNL
jgi:hypothetical protein